MKNERILRTAKTAYETVRTYLIEQDKVDRKPWGELKHKEQVTLYKAVEMLEENSHTNASSVHDAWLERKMKEGWTYGKELDAVKKTDPQMVSYRGLPPIRRKNDKLFHAVVKIGVV